MRKKFMDCLLYLGIIEEIWEIYFYLIIFWKMLDKNKGIFDEIIK